MATSYSNFRENLQIFFDKVSACNVPIYVAHGSDEEVVLISKANYEEMKEKLDAIQAGNNSDNAKKHEYKEISIPFDLDDLMNLK